MSKVVLFMSPINFIYVNDKKFIIKKGINNLDLKYITF